MKKEKNNLIVHIPLCYEYYHLSLFHIFKDHDEAVIMTKHCKWLVEKLVEDFTKNIKISQEVERGEKKDGVFYVKLKAFGAVR